MALKKDEPLRIYIAGPYAPRDCTLHDASRVAYQNVEKVIKAGLKIIEKGHYIFIPHLAHYVHLLSKEDKGEYYYEWDNTFLDYWATAFFYMAPSKGADMELERAKKKGLLIFYKMKDIPVVKNI